MSDQIGVHRTHCCVIHGCKYGDRDCPVKLANITQEYLCEDCTDVYDKYTGTLCEESQMWNKIKEKKRKVTLDKLL